MTHQILPIEEIKREIQKRKRNQKGISLIMSAAPVLIKPVITFRGDHI